MRRINRKVFPKKRGTSIRENVCCEAVRGESTVRVSPGGETTLWTLSKCLPKTLGQKALLAANQEQGEKGTPGAMLRAKQSSAGCWCVCSRPSTDGTADTAGTAKGTASGGERHGKVRH